MPRKRLTHERHALSGIAILFNFSDNVVHFGHINVRPLNGQILINWTPVFSYTNVILYLSDNKDNLGQGTDMGQGNTRPGEFQVKGV